MRIKKLRLILLILIVTGCSKSMDNCEAVSVTAPANEVSNLKSFLTANSIITTEDARGFFYQITQTGSGTAPTVCSNITVNYEGKLTDGTVFDSGTNVSFPLENLIIGWQEGIPLIASGGTIILYLPPSFAYGSSGSGSIPGNSNLIFTIDLISIN